MDDWDWVILDSLYEKKNITKAAEKLYISQPTLTTRLRQMEDRFGVQIVIRGKRGVHFTPEGEYLVKYAQKMLKELNLLEGILQTLRNEVSGSLKIGASNFFTRYKLPNLLKGFRELYPNVEFKVLTNLSGKIVDLVYEHQVDIAFVRGDYEWSDQKKLLFTENMYIVSACEFDMANLPVLPRIDYISNKLVRQQLENWWKQNFLNPPYIGMEVDRVDSCKEMVTKELGYAFLPGAVLDADDGLYKVQMKTKEGETLSRSTWMFYHEESLQIALIKTFIDYVKNSDFSTL